IHAQDLQHEWWVVENPDNPGELCWVLQEGVLPHGDASSVPMWNAPEEEVTIPQCHRDLNQTDCIATGGEWKIILTKAGADYCECPQ
ncbi:MAG: hypothetical protein MUO58_10040, partial [Anaerolineales bacterium]|nr:hypothetical protein [Anaerolineales bacterium]